jgi:hypothetical protein
MNDNPTNGTPTRVSGRKGGAADGLPYGGIQVEMEKDVPLFDLAARWGRPRTSSPDVHRDAAHPNACGADDGGQRSRGRAEPLICSGLVISFAAHEEHGRATEPTGNAA